ncbi:sugar ABC transporter permease [Microbacterium pseudoresistens]|uniref:Raffinose/stachyose/melibiose transport system permease protein n=1 Tax=Microbacterium pseudoresistens TaxID=640634 RepID=A0A7Y9EUW6_9MICO|nr:sugar ABC transporter permease [Microbacterium pseudoresistens]NYD54404.1 raffinose/stachyose/melibiose transport system permease protein [Microbacterium pseudoresistens]
MNSTRRFSPVATALLPALAIYGVFTIYPIVQGLFLSFTDTKGGPKADFAGTANYEYAFSQPLTGQAVVNTLFYAVIVVIVQNGLGLVFARILSKKSDRVRTTISMILLCPALISPVMASFIWSYLYRPDTGFNAVLEMLGLEALQRVWLGDPSTALGAVAAVNIWMFAGYSTAIFLAGFLSLPQDLLEAAEIDGAGPWRRFFRVEWPLLAPSLTVNVSLSLIGCLKVFEFPLVLTGGGPVGSTQTLSLLIYNNIFGGDFAYGLALAMILLVLIAVVAGGVNTLLRRRELYI